MALGASVDYYESGLNAAVLLRYHREILDFQR